MDRANSVFSGAHRVRSGGRRWALAVPAALGATAFAASCQQSDASSAAAAERERPNFVLLEHELPLSRWTEGVEAADVDGDGDHDLFFADGPAFVRPGLPQQHQLVINRMDEPAAAFSNESVLRLGEHASHAKMVITGDANGDGWIDALYCNAFRTAPPALYLNRGDARPGYFDHASEAAGLTEALNSGSGQFGDLDDDGDLDLVLCDSGENLLYGEGGRPRLYLNDGRGVFTERPDLLPFDARQAHVDVQLADLDGDFDLDLLVPCRAESEGPFHLVGRNDGTGRFEDVSAVVCNGSAHVYEIEVGDLDGDRDLDLFFVSLEDYSEGAAENVRSGGDAWRFEPRGTVGELDDNELALFDWDVDGDYDAVVGSLAGAEKWLVNDGDFVFRAVEPIVPGEEDPTMDLTVVDLDGDGRYDLVTAQGEGDPSRFRNRVYMNRGQRDTLPPVIERIEEVPRHADGAFVVHARVRDQVRDDGQDWVSGSGRYRVDQGEWRDTVVTRMAGGLWRVAMPAEDPAAALEYEVTFTDAPGNATRFRFAGR